MAEGDAEHLQRLEVAAVRAENELKEFEAALERRQLAEKEVGGDDNLLRQRIAQLLDTIEKE